MNFPCQSNAQMAFLLLRVHFPYPREGPRHKIVVTKGASLFPSVVSLPPLFLSLTHTRSQFSLPLETMPKDRSKKMNGSPCVSWQGGAEAQNNYFDQQENL